MKNKSFLFQILIAIVLIAIVVIISSSCRFPRTDPAELNCPLPEQACITKDWSGIAQDTSMISAKLFGYYFAVEPVQGINTPDDEWSLSFIKVPRAALTYTDRDRQRMLKVRMAAPNRFSIESGLPSPIDGHAGALSLRGGIAALSIIPEPDHSLETYDEATSQRMLPLGQMIGVSRIYTASYDNSGFGYPEQIEPSNDIDIYTWESQPALSPDGKVIFFASDRPGGFGGTDIWFTVRQPGGTWGNPVNCGDSINTKCDELTPFVTEYGRQLLFASAGHKTVGGYDIFSSEINELFWQATTKAGSAEPNGAFFTEVKNMRPPVNTAFDELFPSCPGDCDSILFYSSNQMEETQSQLQAGGGFDIFVRHKVFVGEFREGEMAGRHEVPDIAFDITPELKAKADGPELTIIPYFTLKGNVYNARTKEPVAKAKVTIKQLPMPEIKLDKITKPDGGFEFELDKGPEYEVTAQAENLFYDSFNFSVDKFDSTQIVKKDFYLPEKLTLRINFPYDMWDSPYRFTLDSNGMETNTTWQRELDLLADNLLISIEKLEKLVLVGHTDLVGSVRYNTGLGRRRVDFVIKELILRGVPADRLEGRSASKLEPLPRRQAEVRNLFHKRLRRVVIEKIYKQG